MFRRIGRGVQHSLTLIRALGSAPEKALIQRMIRFSRDLPAQFDQPLPQMMTGLTPARGSSAVDPDTIRRLADAIAAWDYRSPLGICLRRSLLRYHFLREAGEPVGIVFGARLKQQTEGGGLGGHAWLTLNGQPYHENPQDYDGFVPMYVYPPDEIREETSD